MARMQIYPRADLGNLSRESKSILMLSLSGSILLLFAVEGVGLYVPTAYFSD